MNTVAMVAWLFVFATLFWAATHIKVKINVKRTRYNISSDDCPKEIKEAYFRKHPGAKWALEMEASFDKVNKHMKDFARYLKDNEELHKISDLAAIEIMTALIMGQELLGSAYSKLVKISPSKADRIISKYGVKAATEKYFGDFIEDFYYTVFVLDEMKGKIERKEEFDFLKETCASCKEKAHNIRMQYAAKD